MYNDYGFVLNWNDLPEELREEKINEFITYNYNEGNDYGADEGVSLDEALLDKDNRDNAENSISARFPMYF